MFTVRELLDGSEYEGVADRILRTKVKGVKCDSRKVEKGDAFFCLKGCKCDGADHINEAISNGAKVIVCGLSCTKCIKCAYVVKVPDVRAVYSKAVSVFNGSPSSRLKMIAVTGTNGKTTVCSMIASGLREWGKRVALIGTLGAEFEGETRCIDSMTTPDPEVLYPLLKDYADMGAEYAVMEASSHAIALGKLEGIDFDIGAITNLTPEHLDFHGDMNGYYEAKNGLFKRCKKAVFTVDGMYTSEMFSECRADKVSCSVNNSNSDYSCENISVSLENGTSFTLVRGDRRITLHSPIPAEFTVSNALLAASVLYELGADDESIYRGIARLSGVNGRMEKLVTNRDFDVYIDFAHTPDALAKLLDSVRRFRKAGQRIVTLFGCGGDRDRSKRSLMGAIASRLSDMVIVTEDNSRSEDGERIIDEIMQGFDKSCPHVRIKDRRKAIEYTIENACKGDIILLCGKGHEEYEIDKNGKKYFSEKEIVREALLRSR